MMHNQKRAVAGEAAHRDYPRDNIRRKCPWQLAACLASKGQDHAHCNDLGAFVILCQSISQLVNLYANKGFNHQLVN